MLIGGLDIRGKVFVLLLSLYVSLLRLLVSFGSSKPPQIRRSQAAAAAIIIVITALTLREVHCNVL
jgi:hypothetical protein